MHVAINLAKKRVEETHTVRESTWCQSPTGRKPGMIRELEGGQSSGSGRVMLEAFQRCADTDRSKGGTVATCRPVSSG